jgi:pyruvate dehydrogenase E1 component alpha subunit
MSNSAVTMDRGTALALMHDMVLIRRFEEKCAEEYSAARIRGFLHLYIGEEAVAAGAMRALAPFDAVFATYREHGHALLRGLSANSVMAEMFGKQEGCSGGRGGSMHLFSRERRFFGGNAIVAGALPLAVGYALAAKMTQQEGISACFFGDGAVAEGEFHESLNLAALWQLPVLFLCENNLYAMGTALARSESQVDLCAKAASYKIKTLAVDGMDVVAVLQGTQAAVREMRSTGAPFFIEYKTYRFRAHSMFDPDLYRDPKEVEVWKRRDPIAGFLAKAAQAGLLTQADMDDVEDHTARIIREAVAYAERGTWEPVATLERFVYSEPDGKLSGSRLQGVGTAVSTPGAGDPAAVRHD